MLKRRVEIAGAVLAVLLIMVLAAIPASAAGLGQTGTTGGNQQCISNVTSPSSGASYTGLGNWQTLCGKDVTYTFTYGGSSLPVYIEMATSPGNSAEFFVYSAAQWQQNGNAGTNVPTGAGTSNPAAHNGNLWWQGQSAFAGTYYVVVHPTTQQNSIYWIDLTGNGSGFNLMSAAAAPSAAATTTPAQGTTQGQAPRTLPTTGGSADLALPLLAVALIALGGWLARRRTA